MTAELLYFEGCPGFEQLLPRLRALAGRAGADIVLRPVETHDAAVRARFLGSPTVRVDGRDVEPGASTRTDYGLKCRLYRDAGRQTHLPPEPWLRAALALDA